MELEKMGNLVQIIIETRNASRLNPLSKLTKEEVFAAISQLSQDGARTELSKQEIDALISMGESGLTYLLTLHIGKASPFDTVKSCARHLLLEAENQDWLTPYIRDLLILIPDLPERWKEAVKIKKQPQDAAERKLEAALYRSKGWA